MTNVSGLCFILLSHQMLLWIRRYRVPIVKEYNCKRKGEIPSNAMVPKSEILSIITDGSDETRCGSFHLFGKRPSFLFEPTFYLCFSSSDNSQISPLECFDSELILKRQIFGTFGRIPWTNVDQI
jgi:hypothetical protein